VVSSPPAPPFTRRTALVLLAGAATVFVVGVVSLAFGWIEVATACAAVFTVGWLAMRRRLRRIDRGRDDVERPAAHRAAGGRRNRLP
jgi:cytochrome b